MRQVSFFIGYVLISVVGYGQHLKHDKLKEYVLRAPFKMPPLTEPVFKKTIFNIKDYGAVGDGIALNTQAIKKAINACSTSGGGTVVIPSGLWLTGPIELKSNLNLYADRGALIIFSVDHTLYPVMMPEGRVMSPIYGNKLENVALTGEGIYEGGGDTWRPLKKLKASSTLWDDLIKNGGVTSSDGKMYWPTKQAMEGEAYLKKLKGRQDLKEEDYLPARDFLRPVLAVILNSNNVLIDGPTFKNSPNFALNPRNCSNLIIRNVNIVNEYYAQNSDGIDLSSCKNAIVYRCTVNAGDDGICMKSSAGKGGKTEEALQNIIIADCTIYHAHGGFVIGSNTDGGMRNVYVTNCTFVNSDIGIRIKSGRGRGGLVHDIFIDSIFMRDILNEAILFDTFYEKNEKDRAAEVDERTPIFKDFTISHVYCNNSKTALSITGLSEMPVQRLHFLDIVITADQAVTTENASDISFKNVKILSPQPVLFSLKDSKNFDINGMTFSEKTTTFISAEGSKTTGIKVAGTNLKSLATPFSFKKGASKNAVTIE